jgi:hypothetical protein
MAVQAPDHEERANPTRNVVAGTSGEERVQWVTAVDPDGKKYKLRKENSGDWVKRGHGWRVLGPWVDPRVQAAADAAAKAAADALDSEASEDVEDGKDVADNVQTDAAMQQLIDLRDAAGKLGVAVKDSWGKKRLGQEIAAAKLRAKQSA